MAFETVQWCSVKSSNDEWPIERMEWSCPLAWYIDEPLSFVRLSVATCYGEISRVCFQVLCGVGTYYLLWWVQSLIVWWHTISRHDRLNLFDNGFSICGIGSSRASESLRKPSWASLGWILPCRGCKVLLKTPGKESKRINSDVFGKTKESFESLSRIDSVVTIGYSFRALILQSTIRFSSRTKTAHPARPRLS